MKTFAILVAIASVATVAAPTTVEAKGCMRGAAAGAVGGLPFSFLRDVFTRTIVELTG